MEIKKIHINERKYPHQLRQISDPPETLYYIGNIDLVSDCCIAVVGSRKTTEYGRSTAKELGRKIAGAGGVVVSGMAAGIDTNAHWGALDNEEGHNKTIAVLGCGIDVCYPPANRRLYESIKNCGLIISEYPPGTKPAKYTFPRRNRIISGLSMATVVVQAPNSSGAIITAEFAAQQGRDVYAVPGNINSEYNFGSNKLIRDGALPLVVLDDLITDMGLDKNIYNIIEETLGEDEKSILKLLSENGEMTADQLSFYTGKTVAGVHGTVSVMEMKGLVCMSLGKIFIAK